MVDTPVKLKPTAPSQMTLREHLKTRFGWTMIAFIVMMIVIAILFIWQIGTTAPGYWCKLAEDSSNEGCFSILTKLIDVKDHTIMILGGILGLAVGGLISVALGLNIRASGPGNTSVDITDNTTEVSNDDVNVRIPTPPSEDKPE